MSQTSRKFTERLGLSVKNFTNTVRFCELLNFDIKSKVVTRVMGLSIGRGTLAEAYDGTTERVRRGCAHEVRRRSVRGPERRRETTRGRTSGPSLRDSHSVPGEEGFRTRDERSSLLEGKDVVSPVNSKENRRRYRKLSKVRITHTGNIHTVI